MISRKIKFNAWDGKAQETSIAKFFWKMRYCKENDLPPAQKWAWDRSEEEHARYREHHSGCICKQCFEEKEK